MFLPDCRTLQQQVVFVVGLSYQSLTGLCPCWGLMLLPLSDEIPLSTDDFIISLIIQYYQLSNGASSALPFPSCTPASAALSARLSPALRVRTNEAIWFCSSSWSLFPLMTILITRYSSYLCSEEGKWETRTEGRRIFSGLNICAQSGLVGCCCRTKMVLLQLRLYTSSVVQGSASV